MSKQSDHRRVSSKLRLSVPLLPSLTPSPKSPFPFSPSFSSSTPSKLRHLSSSSSFSFSSLLLLLISLQSLYSLIPFLRSIPPSFSLFPFSFLISLLSLLFYLPFSFSFSFSHPQTLTLNPSLLRPLLAKSLLLTLVFLLRFHSLRYSTASASVLADFAGALAARSLSKNYRPARRTRRVIGFIALTISLSLLSFSWDRIGCFPFFASSFSPPEDGCTRVSALMFIFFSGFLGFHERAAGSSGALRQLGKKRTRLASLVLSTVILFFPACISLLVNGGGEDGGGSVSMGISMVWPLISTVVFGVVLNENFNGEEKFGFGGKSFQQEFLMTFFCTFVLELVYYSRLSLPGFFICGFFLWISVRELGSSSFQYVELGNLDSSGNMYQLIVNPVRHILSQTKTRKIALFLMINTAYMVVEFVAGFVSNSLGLISDACHMLFDCAALSIGLYASYISGLPANNQFNYGRGRFEVLSGYANAVFLVLVGALIVLESMERILDPQEISTSSLLAVSVGGLVVNIIGLVFFHEEHHHAHGTGGSCSHSHSNSNAQIHSISHCDSHGDSQNDHDQYSSKNGHHHTSSNTNVHFQSISHEHSHVGNDEHSLSQSHHHHHCHHNQSDNCDHDSNSNVNLQSISHEHSHIGNDEHSHSHSHHRHDHHHNRSDNCDHHMHGDKHNHNLIRQDHDRHCDHHEHHQFQMHHAGDRNHQESNKNNHEHQNLLIGIKEEGLKMHYHIDHNMEGIFLHVLADTMGSVGVVISTLLIKYKGWLIADPACSIFISVMIISSVVPLLRNSAEILLQRIPRTHEQNLLVTHDSIMRIEGVCGVQNLHVWSFSNSEIVGTVHLHLSSEADKVLIKKKVSDLFHKAGIKDITIQLEFVR